MTTEIIVEDGTQVEDANSYVTLDEARAYAKARGVTITDDDCDAEVFLFQAMDYLEAQRSRFKGKKVSSTQALQWPRCGVWIDCLELAHDEIPIELKRAQMQLMISVSSGINLMPTSDGSAFVTREKVGPIETEYSAGVTTSGVPIDRASNALLAALYNGGGSLTVERG